MMLLIENGELYAPGRAGRRSVLVAGGKVVKVGEVDRRPLDRLGVDYEVIDASGRVVTPGLIDPHEHLSGGSGEDGFGTQSPGVALAEIVGAAITTVVGCLGVDTTMKTIPGLLARVKALRESGMSAFAWTGGYNVPPSTLTDSVRNDILFIDEIIGAGEVAISDARSTDPAPRELARLQNDAYVGGLLSRKAGVTHFHVGGRRGRLALLRTLLDEFEAPAAALYPSHVERSEELMDEAVALAARGCTVDVDVVERDLAKWFRYYREHGGDPGRLTASSDASLTGPGNLFDQVRACVVEHGVPLEEVLPVVTANTAGVLKLHHKGRLAEGMDADLLVIERGSLELVEVVANGKRMVRDGRVAVEERFLENSDRKLCYEGRRRPAPSPPEKCHEADAYE